MLSVQNNRLSLVVSNRLNWTIEENDMESRDYDFPACLWVNLRLTFP